MIILTPEKAFRKKVEKWVRYKDFVIADATEHYNETMSSYGNRLEAADLNASPTLVKIATDPDSAESKIKLKHLDKYLEKWFEQDGFGLKLNYIVEIMLRSYEDYGEDANVFIVLRPTVFGAYHKAMIEEINNRYGVNIAYALSKGTPKEDAKEILSKEPNKDDMKKLQKRAKKFAKQYNDLVKKDPNALLD